MSRYTPEPWRSQLRGPNGQDLEPDRPVGSDLAGVLDQIERDPGVIPATPEEQARRRRDDNTDTTEYDDHAAAHYYSDATDIPWRKRP